MIPKLLYVILLSIVISPLNYPHVAGFKLEKVVIPEIADRGTTETLRCEFKLDKSDTLFSLKWYKDGHEFFRILSQNKTLAPIQTFPQPGVNVQVINSSLHKVVLTNLSLLSSGTYRCEISLDTTFQTVHGEGNLTVIVSPEGNKPIIRNISQIYHMGDTLRGNCTTYHTSPEAQLEFFIHDKKVEASSLIPFKGLNEKGGLVTSVLGVQFVIGNQHFRQGALRLKCVATILNKRRYESEKVIHHRNYYNSNASKSGQRASASGSRHAHLQPLVYLYPLLWSLVSNVLHWIIMSSPDFWSR